jgi:cyclophilin family peptidyl-prolyl cis-trans isomerase
MKPISLIVLPILCLACVQTQKNQNGVKNNTVVRIETTYGNIDIRLYDETPLHRDNFVKLVNAGFYNDLLFHRVINNFMIQGGDPNSKNAAPSAQLGSGGPGYTIPAEFNPELFHKKGAIAAARLGDNANPLKESSGSQFYLVHGTVLSDNQLNELETRINNERKQSLYSQAFRELENEFKSNNVEPDYQLITEKARQMVTDHFNESNTFKYSDVQREAYTTYGGTPHLDGSYTVFGETISGMEVIDKIAASETSGSSRPLTDVLMRISILDK